jgi:PPOX class probable FMN-dependent enzyme
MPFRSTIDSLSALRERYDRPHDLVRRKQIDHIDDGARDFIARSPFFVLATGGPGGGDASPRGGPAGFVRVLDDSRLAFGDLSGNRRLDSFENIVVNPAVGLIFLVPGVGETLRVNGRAALTTDPEVLAACPVDGTVPAVAVGVDVEATYIHCAKAFRRSGLWDPAGWPEPDARPRPAAILRDHLRSEATPDSIEDLLEDGYRRTMWQIGGADQPVN